MWTYTLAVFILLVNAAIGFAIDKEWVGAVTVNNQVKNDPACIYETASLSLFGANTGAGGRAVAYNTTTTVQYPNSGLGLGIQENVWIACTNPKCHRNPDNACLNYKINAACSGGAYAGCAYYGPDGSKRIKVTSVGLVNGACTISVTNVSPVELPVTPGCK